MNAFDFATYSNNYQPKKDNTPKNTQSAFNQANQQTTQQITQNNNAFQEPKQKVNSAFNQSNTINTTLDENTRNLNKTYFDAYQEKLNNTKNRSEFKTDAEFEDYIYDNDLSKSDVFKNYIVDKSKDLHLSPVQTANEIGTNRKEREKANKYITEQQDEFKTKLEKDYTYQNKIIDYESGKSGAEYNANNSRISELNTQKDYALQCFGVDSEQYKKVDEEIRTLKDRNKEIESIANDYNKLQELDQYEQIKASGDEKALADYTRYLSHYEDNAVERGTNMFVGAVTNVVKTATNVYTIAKDKTQEALGDSIIKQAEESLANGTISDEKYNEMIKTAYDFKNYSAVDDQFRKDIENISNEINYAVTQGIDNPVQKFIVNGLQSTTDFLTNFMLMGGLTTAYYGIRTFSETYFSLQNEVDENGNKLYTENQILLNSALNGLLSYATEKIGMDSLMDVIAGKSGNYVYGKALQYMARDILKVSGSEGAEELVEGLLGPIVDYMTLGTPIEYNAGDLFYSVGLGAFSGALMGAGGTVMYTVNTNQQYKALVNDYSDFMKNSDADVSVKEKVTREVNLALNGFENTSQLNKAVQEVQNEVAEQTNPIDTLAEALVPNVTEVTRQVQAQNELLDSIHQMTNSLLMQKGINMEASQYEELTIEQRQEVEKVSNLAKELGADVYFDSNIEVLDENGNPTGQYANGYNEQGQIVINPKSIYNAPINILSHELVHNSEYAESYNDLRDLIKSTIGEEGWNASFNDVASRYGNIANEEQINKEVVAEYIQNNYGNEKFISQLAKYNNNAFSRLHTKMKALIKSDPESQIANAYFKAYKDSIDKVMSMTKPTMFAGNILSANDCQYNIAQYKETGREILSMSLDNMVKKNKITVEEKNEIIKTLDFFAKTIDSIKDANNLENFAKWSDVSMTVDHNGYPQLTCVVANGEYKLNIDFSTVCKKRKITDFVLNEIAKEGLLDKKALSQEDIAKIRDIVKKNDLEVACSLCFVESKRYNQGGWADTLINGKKAKKDKELIKIGAQNSKGYVIGWNGMVDAIAPNGVEVSTFNFAERANPVEGTLHTLSDEQLNSEGVALLNRIAEAKPKSEIGKMAKLLLTNPDMRKHLQLGDLYGSRAFGNIKRGNEDLFKIINSHQGVAKPKSPYVEVTYNNEIITSDSFKSEKARNIGGVRVQSFSDFMTNMVFDYMEMVAELQAKGLTAQSYTKVEEFAKIFGQTGIKINLSIIPRATVLSTKDYLLLDKKTQEFYKQYSGLELFTKEEYNALSDEQKAELSKRGLGLSRDGNYYTAYIFEDESYNWDNALKLQATPGYSKNVGTVCVGVSDEHIWKMLSDDNVKMIIPYHSSSLNKAVAEMINIGAYNEYTEYQNTGVYNASKKNKWTSINSEDNKAYKDFDFYGGEKGMIAQNYDAKAVATSYLEYCAENGLRPKFDKFAFVQEDGGDWVKNDNGSYSKVGSGEGNLTINENYYKLLIDFRAYNEDGIAPQEDVKLNFPENLWDIVKESLLKYESSMVEQNSKMPQILNEVRGILNDGTPNRQYSLGKNSFDGNKKNQYENIETQEVDNNITKFNLTAEEINKGRTVSGKIFEYLRNKKDTFVSTPNNEVKIKNFESGIDFLVYKSAYDETFTKDSSYFGHSKKRKRAMISIADKLDYYIENAHIENSSIENYHNPNGVGFINMTFPVTIEGTDYDLKMMARKSKQGNMLHIYKLSLQKKESLLGTIHGNPDFGDSVNNISQEGNVVNDHLLNNSSKTSYGNPVQQNANYDEQKQIETKTLRDNIADTYQKNIEKYGAFEPGETPRQDIEVPKATDYGPTSQFARNYAETPNMTDEDMMTDFAEAVNNGEFSYDRTTNKADIEKAESKLKTLGLDKLYDSVISNNATNKDTIVEELLLIHKLAENKDYDRLKKLAVKVSSDATVFGQGLQAFRILKMLSPELQLESVEKMRENLQEKLIGKHGNKAPVLVINEELKQKLLDAKTISEIKKARQDIETDLEKQIPNTLADKLNAWRYLSMLGNPKTHIRNILGNLMFVPIVNLKNVYGQAIESVVSNKLDVKTKAFVTKNDKALLDKGYETYNEYFQNNGSKYEQASFGDGKIGKALNFLADKNSQLMDKEDMFFSKRRFAYSFASYLKSNGYNDDNVPTNVLNDAISYAQNEALKATYRDFSYLADKLNEIEKDGPTSVKLLKKALVPFTKTPINIIKRGVEYSPIGLAKTLTLESKKLADGKIDANTYIDNLASGLSGSSIALLGYILGSLGMFRTKDDDKDRKNAFDKFNGEQEYCIDLSPLGVNGTYTIDWMAPAIMPLAIGKELGDLFTNLNEASNETIDIADAVFTICTKSFDPIFETSMLSSLYDSLKSFAGNGEASENVGNMVISMVSSYIQQHIPTLFGQIARSVDDTRRTTYPNTGVIDKTKKQIFNKIPFASKLNEPYIDLEGKEQKNTGNNFFTRLMYNMFSPGYYADKTIDRYDEEIYRLYESTNSVSVFPSSNTTSTSYDKVNYKLTDKEYTEWNKTRWSMEDKLVKQYIDSDYYKNHTDDERVKTIEDIRKYALGIAKEQLLDGRDIEYNDISYQKLKEIANNIDILDYFNYKNMGGSKQVEKVSYLENSDLSQEEKEYLYSTEKYKTSYDKALEKLDKEETETSNKNKRTTKSVKLDEAKSSNSKALTEDLAEPSANNEDYFKHYYNYLKSSSKNASQGSGKVYCPKCGNSVNPTDGKCPICGYSL